MARSEKEILRDIYNYYWDNSKKRQDVTLQQLFQELGREVSEQEVRVLLSNGNIGKA
jgi:hypothetical protein